MYILYSKISTDPGLLKIQHSDRFVAVVIQFLIPFVNFWGLEHVNASLPHPFYIICILEFQSDWAINMLLK